MAQRLILPINNCKLGVGYQSLAHRAFVEKYQGVKEHHYGWDIKGATTVYASGKGTVVNAGWDDDFGYIAIIKYDDVDTKDSFHVIHNHVALVVRYFHMGSVKVSKGQKVTKDTVIGTIGKTGKREFTNVNHVHIEVDTDTIYAEYSPMKPKNGTPGIIKPGNANTILIPWGVFCRKTTAPDNQTISGDGESTWIHPDTNSKYFWYDQYEINSVDSVK